MRGVNSRLAFTIDANVAMGVATGVHRLGHPDRCPVDGRRSNGLCELGPRAQSREENSRAMTGRSVVPAARTEGHVRVVADGRTATQEVPMIRRPRTSRHGSRSALVRVLMTGVSPIILAGCVIGWWPLGPIRPLPSASPTQPPGPSQSTTAFPVPDLPIASLPNAPGVAIWSAEPRGQIRVSVWRAGAVSDLLIVPLLNPDPTYLDHVRVWISPTGRSVAVVEAAHESTIQHAYVRIFSTAGDLLWTGPPDVWAAPRVRWSRDGSRFAVDTKGRWLVVTPGSGPGPAQEISIDTRRPRPAPTTFVPSWEMLDFSEDGETLFGTAPEAAPSARIALVSARAGGGLITPLKSLPIRPGDRLATLPRLGDRPLEASIDPGTARIATVVPSSEKDAYDIEVSGGKPSQRLVLAHSSAGVIATAWNQGALIAFDDDSSGADAVHVLGEFPMKVRLGPERRIASWQVIDGRGQMIAITDGFVLLGFGRGLPEVPSRLALVRLADGSQTAIDADGRPETTEIYGFAGWLPG